LIQFNAVALFFVFTGRRCAH